MKPTSPFIVFFFPLAYLLIAATAGALLAFPIDQALDGAYRLYKVINRCALILMLLGIVPMMRWLKLSAADFGFPANGRQLLHQFSTGFGYGVLVLGVIVFCVITLDIRIIQFDRLLSLDKVLHELSLAIIVSLIVATLEETLFRGFMFGALLKFAGPLYAMTLTALYYAALHFMRSDLTIPADQLSWTSGLVVMFDAFDQVLNPSHLDSFIALFLASIFLTCVRFFVRNGLAYCIGLHAGWVLTIKLTKAFTELDPAAEWGVLVGQYDGLIGYLSSAWLLLLIGVFLWIVGRRSLQGSS
jgi:membrane protease YdiL (CAAX protease family)